MFELSLSQTQQSWITVFAALLAVLQLFGFSPLPLLKRLLRHLGRPGRHLDRIWWHRLIRRAKRILRDPRLYQAGLWKRLFFAVLIVGIGLMFHGALAYQTAVAPTRLLSFPVGTVLYFVGLEAASWATTYVTPQSMISTLRKRLIEAQRRRNSGYCAKPMRRELRNPS